MLASTPRAVASIGIGEDCLLQQLLLGALAADVTDDVIKNISKLTMLSDLVKSCHKFTYRFSFFLASGVDFI